MPSKKAPTAGVKRRQARRDCGCPRSGLVCVGQAFKWLKSCYSHSNQSWMRRRGLRGVILGG